MPISPPSPESILLSSKGWDTCVDAEIIPKNCSQKSQLWKHHAHTLRRIFEDLDIDLVICIDGRPTACIKSAKEHSHKEIIALRNKLWNLGATTLLIIETQTEIKTFSTQSTPVVNQNLEDSLLSEETISNLQTAALSLSLTRLIRRIETGDIYRDNCSLFHQSDTIDQHLLTNLNHLRDKLCKNKSLHSLKRSHALLGKFLFSCYLLDRKIVGTSYLTKNKLPAVEDMLSLLQSSDKEAANTLNTLFNILQKDFNGSIFGDLEIDILPSEIKFFHSFVAGDDIQTGQLSLFRLYDFSFIPVELISSIYQEFLSAESNIESTARTGGQRKAGAYYTPPRLAELTVDIATEGWNTLLDKRCIDTACGSGIFLVILFIRMAEEWRLRNPNATTEERYKLLLTLLDNNLSGSDINRTACLVTCFSLYLALMDQMDPKEIHELRAALTKHNNAKILPRIFWQAEENKPRTPRFATIREIDFFELPTDEKYDLVIGNPPWVSRNSEATKEAESWLFSETLNPATEGLLKSKRRTTLFPKKELTYGFLWKSALHTKNNGRICQILPTRIFLGEQTNQFQHHWIARHKLQTVWNLADHRHILFPGAKCPCLITRYQKREEPNTYDDFEYITPKVELSDPRIGSIPVSSNDQKLIHEKELLDAAKDGIATIVWKKSYWGTPRDQRLLEKLMRLPNLERLTYSPGRGQKPSGDRQWAKGQGFQPATASTQTKKNTPDPIFWNPSDLYLAAFSAQHTLMLSKSQTQAIGTRYKESGLLFPRSPKLYQAPLVLVNKGCTKYLFSDFNILFQDDFQSISGPKKDTNKLLFVTAILSSSLSKYWHLHTSSNLGIERDIIRLNEILNIPFLLPEEMPNPKKANDILEKCASIMQELKQQLEDPKLFLKQDTLVQGCQKKLNKLVYQYYGITKHEQLLIEDTVNIFLPSATPTSLHSPKFKTGQHTTPTQRRQYAETFTQTFREWSSATTAFSTTVTLSSKLGLALFTFTIDGKNSDHQEESSDTELEKILAHLYRNTQSYFEGHVFRKMRNFTYFDINKVHILKPLALSYWTKTQVLNDADSLMRIMMEENGWQA